MLSSISEAASFSGNPTCKVPLGSSPGRKPGLPEERVGMGGGVGGSGEDLWAPPEPHGLGHSDHRLQDTFRVPTAKPACIGCFCGDTWGTHPPWSLLFYHFTYQTTMACHLNSHCDFFFLKFRNHMPHTRSTGGMGLGLALFSDPHVFSMAQRGSEPPVLSFLSHTGADTQQLFRKYEVS